MSKFLFTLILVVFCSSALLAAIPKPSPGLSAEEILTMPEQNRYLLTQKKADEYYPALMNISKSPQQTLAMRWKALTLAAHLKKAKALPELQEALRAQEWFMRNAALVSIQSFDPLQGKAAAKILLQDKALVVRSAAVDVLSKDLDPKTRALLWTELDASYNFRNKQGLWVRGQILSSLSIQPEKSETQKFVKFLNQDDIGNQKHAIAALEILAGKQLGTKKSSLQQRKTLWLNWAKANPDFSTL
jgi:hypothetical protein